MVAPVRILVVDDEVVIARLLTSVLKGEGYEAEYRTNGETALEELRRTDYDLLVTDLRMPGMDGMRLIQEARDVNPDVDAVVVTAYSSADTAISALRQGVADYISKPFSVEDFRSVISKALKARKKRLKRDREVEDLSAQVESASQDVGRHLGDLEFLHVLTRMAADRATPLRACLERVADHLGAETVLLIDGDQVVEHCGARNDTELLKLAKKTIRAGHGLDADNTIAAPVGGGAVVARKSGRFRLDQLQLLSTAGRDLVLAVEIDRLRSAQRRSYVGIVATLIEAVEAKDRFNRGHSRRVAQLATSFAERIGLSVGERELLETAATLHDIGKIGIPEEILNKPGRLTPEEFEIIKSHPVIGEQILKPLDFLSDARTIVRHHHERWDGGGYPDGLAGDEIPRPAALLAIVDSYDAMTSTRPYREGMTQAKARAILDDGAGVQWDPELVQQFGQV